MMNTSKVTKEKSKSKSQEIVALKCKANGATITNGFTDEKVYPVRNTNGNVFVVLNDNGHERVVIPNTKSGHLKITVKKNGWIQEPCVGHFEPIYKNE